MATVTSGYIFVNNETVTPAKLNSLAGGASISGIVNADISPTAAIADTKIATIATAGKVSNSATTADSANTASAIVTRDSGGNFSAGTITANVSGNVSGNVTGNLTGAVIGNAATASTFQTARTIAISGDASGTATSFNGSANITIPLTLTPGIIVDANISSIAAIADSKLATISTAGKVSNTATTAASANTANSIVARDASGNFTAGTITATLSGNASTATTLAGTGPKSLCKAWINFDGTTAGTFAGGTSTVSRTAGSTTATITTTTAHGLITGNSVYALTGVAAGAYIVTFLNSTTFTIQTVATTVLSAASITFQFLSIRSSYNVSSVVKNGTTGDCAINFPAGTFADTNYCASWLVSSTAAQLGSLMYNSSSFANTATSFRFTTVNWTGGASSPATVTDSSTVMVSFFGN